MSLTPQQLEMRRTGIGASEVAALVGLNPYARPIDVYSRKVDGEAFDGNRHTERGEWFERPTADWWAARNRATIRTVGTLRHPKRPIVLATPDFLATLEAGGELALEIKVPGPRTFAQWGVPGTDEAPPWYVAQVQYTLAVCGLDRGVIAAPIDGELAEYPIAADAELQGMLMDAAERFWRDHVEPRRPPPPDASDNYSAFLRRRFETSKGPVRRADAVSSEWAARFREARAERERWEEQEKLARQHLEAAIGDAEGIDGNGWSVRWPWVKGRTEVNWKALIEEAGVSRALVEKHTGQGKPYRRFTMKEESK